MTEYTLRPDGVAVKNMTPAEIESFRAWDKAREAAEQAKVDKLWIAAGYRKVNGEWLKP
jgi:hypothetical protein